MMIESFKDKVWRIPALSHCEHQEKLRKMVGRLEQMLLHPSKRDNFKNDSIG
jgi:hypothetical protein